MAPDEILAIVLQLGALVSAITVGLTGAYKSYFPKANPLDFSIPCGAVVMVAAYFAALPVPNSVQGWMGLIVVVIIGGLLPSGLFDAGVNLLQKARRV